MPLLADEGIHAPADVVQAVRTRAADQINIKVLKCGGLLTTMEMAAICRANHLPVLIGSMIESGIGSLAAAHLAIALPGVFSTELCGPLLFANDVLGKPWLYDPGRSDRARCRRFWSGEHARCGVPGGEPRGQTRLGTPSGTFAGLGDSVPSGHAHAVHKVPWRDGYSLQA